jgi:TatA/E family protein of Tat protein translocase
MPFGLGVWELLIIFAVLLLLFGARRLPEMGKSLGHGMREFKDAVTGAGIDDTPAAPEPPEVPARTTAPEVPARTAEPESQQSETERVSG